MDILELGIIYWLLSKQGQRFTMSAAQISPPPPPGVGKGAID